MIVNWGYVKVGATQVMGYGKNADMEVLIPEYMELLNFIFPDMMLLVNIDWSSNFSIMAPDAHVL